MSAYGGNRTGTRRGGRRGRPTRHRTRRHPLRFRSPEPAFPRVRVREGRTAIVAALSVHHPRSLTRSLSEPRQHYAPRDASFSTRPTSALRRLPTSGPSTRMVLTLPLCTAGLLPLSPPRLRTVPATLKGVNCSVSLTVVALARLLLRQLSARGTRYVTHVHRRPPRPSTRVCTRSRIVPFHCTKCFVPPLLRSEYTHQASSHLRSSAFQPYGTRAPNASGTATLASESSATTTYSMS